MKRTLTLLAFLLIAIILPLSVSAHQPRIVDSGMLTVVEQPEVSKAFYGQLRGEPQIFQISSSSTFKFYVNVLVPDVEGTKKDVVAEVVNVNSPNVRIAVVGGVTDAWKPFFEKFARDDYFMASEFRSELTSGTYQIKVTSSSNDSAYTLAIGEAEAFGFSDIIDAYVTIPQIKNFFFHKPALSAFLTPFLGVPIVVVLVVLFLVHRLKLLKFFRE